MDERDESHFIEKCSMHIHLQGTNLTRTSLEINFTFINENIYNFK